MALCLKYHNIFEKFKHSKLTGMPIWSHKRDATPEISNNLIRRNNFSKVLWSFFFFFSIGLKSSTMWPNSRLQAGEITDFIMPAWCSPVKAWGTRRSPSRRLCRKLCPDRSPLASCEKQQREEVMLYCAAGSEVCVPLFASEKAHSGGWVTPKS